MTPEDIGRKIVGPATLILAGVGALCGIALLVAGTINIIW